MSYRTQFSKGFTLVEMVIVAPIVILFIGGVIYLLVNLTGETIASRSEDALTYDLQRALSQIEADVKTSERFLAASDIPLASTGQGYGDTTSTNSTTPFTNISDSSSASLILRTHATNGNSNSDSTHIVFLANDPHNCSDPAIYSANAPLIINIVYFTDSNGTLWRRTLMPVNYDSPSHICGAVPWQLPSCIEGYSPSRTFCKTNDEKVAEGATFAFSYYTSASAGSPNATAGNPASNEAARNAALLTTRTVRVDLSTAKSIAGRDVSRSSTGYATRMND